MCSTPSRAAPAVAAAVLLLVAASPSAAQPAAGERSCTLELQPTDSTQSVSRRVGGKNYVTYLWNGMTWLCGGATMTADSAVRYETRRRLELVGAVHYRDTIRDLRSGRLTYFQPESRVLAEDSVRLRQLETGSVLRGPRVEFFNMVRGEGTERTVATERPRMTIPPPGDTAGDPFRVVADTAVFVGEEAAEAFGDVVVRRGQLTARGGYTRFRIPDGSGFLTRSPSVQGESFTLTGDTIRVGFAGTRLRTVRAVSGGHLRGEEVEVRAPRIVVRLENEQVDELWARGSGGARAYSADQQIRGDSLHFAFAGGRLTRLTAVGSAAALQMLPSDSLADARAPAPDTTARPGAASDTAAREGVRAGDVPSDSAASDPAAARTGRGGSGAAPGPGLDLRRSWIAGDTVRALFAAAAPPDSASPDAPARDSVRTAIERIVAAGNARSFYLIERDSAETGGGAAPSESTAAADTARARRDSGGPGSGGRKARNYVIGDRITIRFRDGSPLSVQATRAIGLFLEPTEMPDSLAADTAGQAPDTASAVSDTSRPARDTSATDSATVDTPRIVPDSVPADTAAPPDSTGARRDRARSILPPPRRGRLPLRARSASAHSRGYPV